MLVFRSLVWSSLWLAGGCLGGDEPCRPGAICTIAGAGLNGYDEGADDKAIPARRARMSFPQDTLTAADGALYILDWHNHRLRRLDTDGKIRWVAGDAELGGPFKPSDGLDHPAAMTFAPSGQELIIAGWHDNTVWSLDLDGGDLTRIAGDGRRAYAGDGGPAVESALALPASVAFGPGGDLVVMDQQNQVLRVIDSAGAIHTLAGRCIVEYIDGRLDRCEEPAACPDSDKLTCGDPADTCQRSCSLGYAGDGGPAAQMRMAQPYGGGAAPSGRFAFDASANLYFADTANHLIRMIDTKGMVHRVAGRPPVDGQSQAGYAGDGGDARDALLNQPVDLAFADDGTLYFTDVRNHCVRAIDPAGQIATVAGQCGMDGYEGDGGAATDALLDLPFGVEWVDGHLNISDTGNNVIRRVVLAQ